MTADRPVFPDDPDLLRQRPAASRPRLYDGRVRCAGAVHAARRAQCQIPDRHRRAWPEGRALGAARAGIAPQEFADRNLAAPSATWTRLLNISNDDFIRTTEPRHIARRAGAVAGTGAPRRDLSRPLCRLVFGARRGLLRRERTGRGPAESRADRRRGRMAGGRELFLPAVGLAGPAAGLVRGAPRCDRAAQPAQRGHQLCQRRAQGSVDLAHQLQLGHPGAGRPASMSSMSGSTR